MDIFKRASREKLRFETSKGVLSAEQLWDLPQSGLASAIKNVKKILQKDNDDDLNFLDDAKVVDKVNQLRFEILKDVYLTKKTEAEEARNKVAIKEHNEEILALIAEKEKSEMKEKGIDDLKKMLK